ncbi:MAG: hypothetical protein K0R34_1362 [Herbinix sp.]|jgi:hypothetical protein|nr:hypothetical protein [Herbinix sp.]
MPRFKEADFYYGSVLSILFSNHITPVLIENNSDRQVYDYTTNKGNFRAFIKYRTTKKMVKQNDYNCWDFNIANDCVEIKQYFESGYNVIMFLVCGTTELKESELAILTKDDLIELFNQGKKTISISRKKHEKAFRIAMGSGRGKSLTIKNNRIDELF